MVDQKNYYQQIIAKINQLVSQKEWKTALNIITDELAAPYIPEKYEHKFHLLFTEINQLLMENKPKVNPWTIEKIIDFLQSSDEEKQIYALYQLQHYNARLILPVISDFLANPKINNLNKTHLLLLLKDQGINQSFPLNKTHGQFNVNPQMIVVPKTTKVYQAIDKLLKTEIAVDEPGTYQICLFILNRYFESLLPNVLPFNQHHAIAAALYIRACSLQFIKVTLLSSAKKFHSTTSLIKHYLLDLNQHQIT